MGQEQGLYDNRETYKEEAFEDIDVTEVDTIDMM
jgi:hypothetical protein